MKQSVLATSPSYVPPYGAVLNQSVLQGATATFAFVGGGNSPLTYQWYKNGALIGGATSSTYQTPATDWPDDGATFSVQVSNWSGSFTASATLNVLGCCASPCIVCDNSSFNYDIDVAVNSLPLAAAPLSGSRIVRPCFSQNCNLVDPSARVGFRVKNNTAKCIHVQFYTDFASAANIRIGGRYGCGGTYYYPYGGGLFLPWFYLCIYPSGPVANTMDHFLGGTDANTVCQTTGSIKNWQWAAWCFDSSNVTDGCYGHLLGCPSC